MSIPDPETVGERLARQRRRMKLAVRDLAEKADVAAKTVSNIEAGGSARDETLDRLARALEVPVKWLKSGEPHAR